MQEICAANLTPWEVQILEKGEYLARRLSFIFEEEKEVIQLSKTLTDDLKELIRANQIKEDFKEFCIDSIKKEVERIKREKGIVKRD